MHTNIVNRLLLPSTCTTSMTNNKLKKKTKNFSLISKMNNFPANLNACIPRLYNVLYDCTEYFIVKKKRKFSIIDKRKAMNNLHFSP